MKKPTIKDIAAAAGVSPASVSMILNGKNLSRFTEQTIQNVYRSSRQLGYLSKKQQRHKNPKEMILIVCPSLMNPYYATLTQSMEPLPNCSEEYSLTIWKKIGRASCRERV